MFCCRTRCRSVQPTVLHGTVSALGAVFAMTIAVAQLRELDRRLADTDAKPEAAIVLRMRARIGVISEALSEHRSYFDTGAAHEIR